MRFSTTTELMPHQMDATVKLLPSRVGALFADMGTGKSRILLELAKLRAAKWDRFFWFAPVSLKETVRYEVLKHTTLTPNDIYTFDARTDERTMRTDALVYIIGIESMSSANRVVLAYNALVTERSFVAVDESAYIKGHRSKRTQRITHMSARARYRAVLTGTPFTQGAVDLYSQMSFLSPKILGYRSFWSFANNHIEYEERRGADGKKRRTGRIVRCHNEDYLAAKIAPYTYQVRKDECLTLPDKLYETRYFSMTRAQRELYEQAKSEILSSADYDDWSPIRIFHLFTTLQSIVCGHWNRVDPSTGRRETIEIEHKRVGLLIDTIAEIPEGEKVIIWAKYHYAIEEIVTALSESYGAASVAQFHGGNASTRQADLQRWRTQARFLVATQQAGGVGQTFNEAAYSIFYADGFKYSERIQAEDRNHRIGQQRRPVYITLQCLKSIDDRISKALRRKEDALREFQSSVELYKRQGMRDKAVELVRGL